MYTLPILVWNRVWSGALFQIPIFLIKQGPAYKKDGRDRERIYNQPSENIKQNKQGWFYSREYIYLDFWKRG